MHVAVVLLAIELCVRQNQAERSNLVRGIAEPQVVEKLGGRVATRHQEMVSRGRADDVFPLEPELYLSSAP